VWNQKKK